MSQNLPAGWDEKHIREIAEYYDHQTEEEAIAEAEAADRDPNYAWVQVPLELLPEVRKLLAKHEKKRAAAKGKA